MEKHPLPQPDEVTEPFWGACRQRRLCFQSCSSCGFQWLPGSVVCPRCWSDETSWVEARGDGMIFSFAVYRRSYHAAFPVPYAVAVVELAEGPRLVSNIIEVPAGQVRIGMPVKVAFVTVGEAVLPLFRPAGKEG